ncbi:MAG TPA: NAD(P)/FAD-dependent oxidoreductase [Candidatus Limiplasma sp.]|nr:NAD(P)/FAD-dependent oxidoreductase [Candidatus Limiplasma sp.]
MKKVIIIGAGPAGLTAAYELLKKHEGYDVTVLEKSDSIGGISKTVRHDGNRMDIGGHRFFSKDQAVMDWWQEVMPLQGAPSLDDRILQREVSLAPDGPDPEQTDRVMLVRNRVSRIYYQKHFFDYPISLKWSTLKTMGFGTTLQVGFSYLHSVFHKLPETSLENFYINSFGRKLYSMFFEGYTEKLWGRHPREISADWGAQRTKGLSIRAILMDMLSKLFMSKEARAQKVQTSLIEEFHYPKFGPGQLWETVADDVRNAGGKVLTLCDVCGLETENDVVRAVRYRENGEEKRLEGDAFFSSMPIKDLIRQISEAPGEIQAIADGLPYRDFVTVGLLVNRLNLKNETHLKTLGNIVPDCWIYVQDTNVKLGRIQIFNNWSPYLVKDPEHTVWIGLEYFCAEGDDFWNMDAQACANFAMDELITMGVINSRAEVLDTHRERVQKAYPAYFDTYDEIGRVIDYLNSFENLFCVGRNGQHRYNNMDHSMATSFEAVKALTENLADRRSIWNVNTEKEYHEEKAN